MILSTKQTIVLLITIINLTFFIGCSSSQQSDDSSNGERIVRIDPKSRQRENLMLSDIIDSIRYVPLETNDNCLLGTILHFFICSENYVLFDNTDNKIYLFSKTGNFIAQIGNVGSGPGEYLNNPNLTLIDEKNSQIIITNFYPRQSMYYDFSGKFIKSVPLSFDYEIGFINYFESHLYSFYVMQTSNSGSIQYTYTVLDTTFSIFTQKITPVQFSRKSDYFGYQHTPLFNHYLYNDTVHIRENLLNDTLYMVNNDFSFIPKYIINSGKYDVTVDLRSGDVMRFFKELKNCVVPWSMFETKNYLFILYDYQNRSIPCFYNKKENKVVHIATSSSGIPNDFDGGLDFWPVYQNDKELIAFYDAYKFVEHKKNANKFKLKGGKDAINRFDQMIRNLKTDDNPVMVIVKLK